MPEYINIISQESIDGVPTWVAIVGTIIAITICCTTFIYWAFVKDPRKVLKWICWAGPIALGFAICWHIITCSFFSMPTGRYRYEATIDKDNITVAQYEEFIKEYHPTIDKNKGIYYWEDPLE